MLLLGQTVLGHCIYYMEKVGWTISCVFHTIKSDGFKMTWVCKWWQNNIFWVNYSSKDSPPKNETFVIIHVVPNLHDFLSSKFKLCLRQSKTKVTDLDIKSDHIWQGHFWEQCSLETVPVPQQKGRERPRRDTAGVLKQSKG